MSSTGSNESLIEDGNNPAMKLLEHIQNRPGQTVSEPRLSEGSPSQDEQETTRSQDIYTGNHTWNSGTHEVAANERKPEELQKELLTQEKIIVALQNDNEYLRRESKKLQQQNKQLSENYYNLEAKHSLLVSSIPDRSEGRGVPQKGRELSALKHESEKDDELKTLRTLVSTQEKAQQEEIDFLKSQIDHLEKQLNHEGKQRRYIDEKDNILLKKGSAKQAERIKQLEEALLEKDRYAEAALERLRIESTNIRRSYEDKVAMLQSKLDAKLSISPRADNSVDSSQKVEEALLSPQHVTTMLENISLKQKLSDIQGKLNQRATDDKSQLEDLRKEIAGHKDVLVSSNLRFEANQKEWERKLEDCRTSFASDMRNLRQDHNAELNRLQLHHQSEVRRLSKGLRDSRNLSLLETLKNTPSNSKDSILEGVIDRLSFLEDCLEKRESECKYQIDEMQRVLSFEKDALRKKMEVIIDQKNHQITQFRQELDSLISGIAGLGSKGSTANTMYIDC